MYETRFKIKQDLGIGNGFIGFDAAKKKRLNKRLSLLMGWIIFFAWDLADHGYLRFFLRL